MEQLSLFDKQISDDWLWKFSDYPINVYISHLSDKIMDLVYRAIKVVKVVVNY